MSDKKMQGQPDQDPINKPAHGATQPIRRQLLKGTITIPVIMTLHSGAALARTSNLVGRTENPGDAKIEEGRYACAYDAVEDSSGKYDLGDSPQLELVESPLDCIGDPDDPEKPGGGILISVSAYNSLQGRSFFTD